MKFTGDIVITDPMKIIKKGDDWNDFLKAIPNCIIGHNFDTYANYIIHDLDSNDVLGKFCTDSGTIGVFLLDDVLRYNRKYNDFIDHRWAVTWICDFDGEINFEKEHTANSEEDIEQEDSIVIVGSGSINFESSVE